MAYGGNDVYDGLPDYRPGIKNDRAVLINSFLLNGSSSEMAVDGSSTPITFKYTNDDTTWDHYITEICLFIQDLSSDWDGIGGSGLTNGIQLYHKSDGTDYNFINNVKSLYEIVKGFPVKMFGYASDLNRIPNVGGAGGQEDAFVFCLDLPIPLRLAANDTANDNISCVIKDDLTDLSSFECRISGYKVRGIQDE